MWHKVTQFNSDGLNKSQISRDLGIDRATVRKYLSMDESEFYLWLERTSMLPNKLQNYYPFIRNLLVKHPYLSASQIEDRLKENFRDLPKVHSNTVYNFVKKIRKIEHIKKVEDHQPRIYQKLPELAYGHQCQVDFGVYNMLTQEGSRKKVYFMVMVLCRSRYKFVYSQDKPFTSKSTVEAHEKGLQFFGGQPRELVYDQDRVLIVDENLGDVLLTGEFRTYCNQMDFKTIFCRKADPESKGKVENVVGFVKKNFLRGRIYTNIAQVNSELTGWLERTGNGKEHAGIKKIPAQEWIIEQAYLIPLKTVIAMKEELKRYRVRKDNTISYKSNFYTLPLGTYANADTWVLLEVQEDMVNIYTINNSLLTTHPLSTERGSTIRNTDHNRDKSESISVLKQTILKILPDNEKSILFIELLHKDKPRYVRDNLLVVEKKAKEIASRNLLLAIEFCLENKVYNSNRLIEIAIHYQKQMEQDISVKYDIPVIKSNKELQILTSTVQTSKINSYEKFM